MRLIASPIFYFAQQPRTPYEYRLVEPVCSDRELRVILRDSLAALKPLTFPQNVQQLSTRNIQAELILDAIPRVGNYDIRTRVNDEGRLSGFDVLLPSRNKRIQVTLDADTLVVTKLTIDSISDKTCFYNTECQEAGFRARKSSIEGDSLKMAQFFATTLMPEVQEQLLREHA